MIRDESALPHRAVAHLPPKPASALAARNFVLRRLHHWQLNVPASDTMLLVSEVVTNAVTHVHSVVTLTVATTPDGSGLRVEVGDDSPLLPRTQTVGPDAERGRGMFLLDALASRWGVDSHASPGKTVWFEMWALPGADRRP